MYSMFITKNTQACMSIFISWGQWEGGGALIPFSLLLLLRFLFSQTTSEMGSCYRLSNACLDLGRLRR